MKEIRGLIVNVFESKSIGNCSNNGVSSRYKELILIPNDYCPDIPKLFHSEDEHKLIHIIGRRIGERVYYHAESVNKLKGNEMKNGPMFGGTFIHTSDSRFPFDYPIPLHDRFETTF